MTPRPFHRWKTFWFGLLILAFLGWGWARSMTHHDFALFSTNDGSWSVNVSQSRGGLNIAHRSPSFFRGPDRINLEIHQKPILPEGQNPWPAAVDYKIHLPRIAKLSIAHWFLILLFLIPWTGFLIRRHRRLNRLTPP